VASNIKNLRIIPGFYGVKCRLNCNKIHFSKKLTGMNVTSLHKEINSPYFQAKLIFSYFYLLFCKPGELFFIPTLRNSSHQQHTFKYFLCSFFSAAENLTPFDPAYTTEFCLKMQISFSFLFRDPTYAILAAQPNSRFLILILI